MASFADPLETATEVMRSMPGATPQKLESRFKIRLPENPGAWAKVSTYQRQHDIHKWNNRTKVRIRAKKKQTKWSQSDQTSEPSSPPSEHASQHIAAMHPSEGVLGKTHEEEVGERVQMDGQEARETSPISVASKDTNADVSSLVSESISTPASSVLSELMEEEEPDPMLKTYSVFQLRYKENVEFMEVAPLRSVHRQLDTFHMDLKRARMSRGEFKAIATTLCSNPVVSRLDLTECMLDDVKVVYLCDLLAEDTCLTDLILTDNQMGGRSVRRLIDSLMFHDNMVYLDISGNGLRDDTAEKIAEYLKESAVLTYLLMKRNQFGRKAGALFGEVMRENNRLVYLDVSWNNLRKKGATDFLLGIASNSNLEHLDVSWNGLREEGSTALKHILAENTTLTRLNICGTGMNSKCIANILDGLSLNTVLQKLTIYHNPLLLEDFTALLQGVYNMPDTGLHKIDLGEQTIDEGAVPVVDKLFWEKSIDVSYGSTIGYSDSRHQGGNLCTRLKDDALALVTKLKPEKRLALVKYFKKLDKKAESERGRGSEILNPFLLKVQTNTVTYRDLAQRIKMEGDSPHDIINHALAQIGRVSKGHMQVARHSADIQSLRNLELKAQMEEMIDTKSDLSLLKVVKFGDPDIIDRGDDFSDTKFQQDKEKESNTATPPDPNTDTPK
ncbi:leucine-rich repeat-containing protein 74A [Aplysia californica]|uniref:Leucine-rich repeat-containing protein 74A n=1 Tax=Aplysia californica TaxID=6500 RepID=A0ABM0K0T7_APLCA|nr:leucine-rich repeat-containing protein 74A [Aplysia californica]